MDDNRIQLSIIIPALNEERSIGACVCAAMDAIGRFEGMAGEVIVADNGSMDQTGRIAQSMGARVVSVTKPGYGNALVCGLRAARGEYLVMADADGSYDFKETALFIEKFKSGYDVVIGNRFKGKIEKASMPLLHRYLGTPILTWIANLLFKTGVGDINCGMRAITKRAFDMMCLEADGMECATEMVIKAARLKLKVAEVPCSLRKDTRGRRPHLKTWKDGWRNLKLMIRSKKGA